MTPKSLLYPLSLTVVGFKEDTHDYHFHAEAPEPKCCEACGTIGHVVRFGKQDQSYRDVPIHGKRVTIWIVRRRYRCDSCGSTFRPVLEDMDDRRMMTKRLVKHIEKAASTGSNSEVARAVGVDEKTVRLVFEDFYKASNSSYKPVAPRVLGIDELYLGRVYRAIFTNITESTVIDLLPSRSKVTVVNFLSHLEDKKDIEIVCTDMWNPYREATRAVLPQATLIVDKFHITRMANEALEVVRKGLKAGLTTAQRKTLKGDRKLLLMRRHDVEARSMIIESWLNAFPELGQAYQLKEGFFSIWDAEDEADARERFAQWKADIPASQKAIWSPIITSMANWENEIFAYFRPGHQYTNAFTESSNRGIKDRQRDARGMKFESYRAKILFSQRHRVAAPKPRNDSPFSPSFVSLMTSFATPGYFDFGVPISTVKQMLMDGDL